MSPASKYKNSFPEFYKNQGKCRQRTRRPFQSYWPFAKGCSSKENSYNLLQRESKHFFYNCIMKTNSRPSFIASLFPSTSCKVSVSHSLTHMYPKHWERRKLKGLITSLPFPNPQCETTEKILGQVLWSCQRTQGRCLI